MKYLNLSLIAASLFTCFAASAAPAYPSDTGSLHVTGQILNQTCSVDSAQMTKTVTFAPITIATLTAAAEGDVIASQPLQFDVSSCPNTVTRVGIKFGYTADAAGNYLANTAGTPAGGVLMGISEDGNTTAVAADTIINSAAADLNATAGTAVIKAKANLYKLAAAGAEAEGDITSTANVTVDYQ